MSAADYYWIQWGNGKRYYMVSTGASVPKAMVPRDLLPHILEKDRTLQAQELGTTIRELKARINHLRNYSETIPTVKATIAKKEAELQTALTKFAKFPMDIQTTVCLNFDPNQYQFKPPTVKKKKDFEGSHAEFWERYAKFSTKHPPPEPKIPPTQPIPPRPVPKAAPKPQNPKPKGSPHNPIPPRPVPKAAPKPKAPPHNPIPPRPVPKSMDEALLARHGISSKKDWKKWMMINHPDKNPNCNLEVVQSVCAAANRMYRN